MIQNKKKWPNPNLRSTCPLRTPSKLQSLPTEEIVVIDPEAEAEEEEASEVVEEDLMETEEAEDLEYK